MSGGKTMISDTLPYEELKNRKIFFVICDVLSDELQAKLTKFTKHTGVEFMTEKHDGFWVIKKVSECLGHKQVFKSLMATGFGKISDTDSSS
jgi:hypothetical protein